MKPILNIITVTKDDPEGIDLTINSTERVRASNAIRQIVIDSSSEEIRDRVKELSTEGQNIDYYWQSPSGISSAFNLGLSLSDAEWVWFLNGKDILHPNLNVDNLLYLLEASQADAIIFEIELKQSRTRLKHPPLWALWPPTSCWIPHPATLTRKTIYEQYGKFDESYRIAMDFEFWLRSFSSNAVVDIVSIPIAIFDQGGLSCTQSYQTSSEACRAIKINVIKLLKIWFNEGILLLKTWRMFFVKSKSRKNND